MFKQLYPLGILFSSLFGGIATAAGETSLPTADKNGHADCARLARRSACVVHSFRRWELSDSESELSSSNSIDILSLYHSVGNCKPLTIKKRNRRIAPHNIYIWPSYNCCKKCKTVRALSTTFYTILLFIVSLTFHLTMGFLLLTSQETVAPVPSADIKPSSISVTAPPTRSMGRGSILIR